MSAKRSQRARDAAAAAAAAEPNPRRRRPSQGLRAFPSRGMGPMSDTRSRTVIRVVTRAREYTQKRNHATTKATTQIPNDPISSISKAQRSNDGPYRRPVSHSHVDTHATAHAPPCKPATIVFHSSLPTDACVLSCLTFAVALRASKQPAGSRRRVGRRLLETKGQGQRDTKRTLMVDGGPPSPASRSPPVHYALTQTGNRSAAGLSVWVTSRPRRAPPERGAARYRL